MELSELSSYVVWALEFYG